MSYSGYGRYLATHYGEAVADAYEVKAEQEERALTSIAAVASSRDWLTVAVVDDKID